jgi:hypothetical protein
MIPTVAIINNISEAEFFGLKPHNNPPPKPKRSRHKHHQHRLHRTHNQALEMDWAKPCRFLKVSI